MSELGFSNEVEEDQLFFNLKSNETFLIGEYKICKVFSQVGGGRDPLAPTIIKVENIFTGKITLVHIEEVREIVCTYEADLEKRLEAPKEGPISNFLPTVENYEKKISKNKLSGN